MAFVDAVNLTDDPSSACLYLVSLHCTGTSVRRVRTELRDLDSHRAAQGGLPYSRYELIEHFVRGLHAQHPAQPMQRHRLPLYTEDVAAMIAAIGPPRTAARDVAVLLLADASHLPAAVLRRLQWWQVHLRDGQATVQLAEQPRAHSVRGAFTVDAGQAGLCAVEALRHLRQQRPPSGNEHVFGVEGALPSVSAIAEILARLPGRGGKWSSHAKSCPPGVMREILAELRRDGVHEVRDRALLGLSFAACLTTAETSGLRFGQLSRRSDGLLLDLPGRQHIVAVPLGAVPDRCPVRLWDAWAEVLRQRRWSSDMPAFPLLLHGAIRPEAAGRRSLNQLVRVRAMQAGLDGAYDFTSLRTGFIRSAIRASAPQDLIAAQAGLRRLESVERHRAIEQRITHSAAGRVGL